METIYCTLDAKRLTLQGSAEGRRASGGGETVYCAVVPRRPAAHGKGKTVIYLDDYRRPRPEERGREAAPPRPGHAERPRRRFSLALAADLTASAAVVGLLAVVAAQLLAL